MSIPANRRQFLQSTAVAGIGFWVAGGLSAQESKSPNEKVAIACIGTFNKGQSDSKDAGANGDVVAVCDVDEGFLAAAAKRFPKAKQFTDYRKMLDEMGKSIDAVTVSTPDHHHAPASLMAMRMGKHCFCQKPLTKSIYEARLMAKVAAEMKVATQMGNQGTSYDSLRKSVAVIKTGALGPVKEVHVWTDRPIWDQGKPRPEAEAAPKNVDWNLWLGPASVRPWAKRGVYHPFAWRGWWDFGTGALGDMACHTVNMPYAALKLANPTAVQAKCSGHNGDSYRKWSEIVFDFPATADRPALKLFWYDGKHKPKEELFQGAKVSKTGALVIGEKATLFGAGDYGDGAIRLLGSATMPDEETLKWTKSPGHFVEWINAIKGGEPAASNFANYSGGLTETILLGNLAVWVAATGEGEKVEWDAKNMKCTNIAGLETIVKPIYRPGYTLDV